MVFSSLIFLFAFLPVALIGYYLIPNISYKNVFFLIVSILFYAWGEPVYVFLILFSILLNYIIGIFINRYSNQKKLYLIVAITFNLGLIIIFKYSSFLVSTINYMLLLNIPLPKIALPLGISFFTFKILTYIVDVYRGTVGVQKNFIKLALYISMFPQLLAGPIARYSAVAGQLEKREHSLTLFRSGIERFIIGLGKKVILANNLALIADGIFNDKGGTFGSFSAWIGIISYSMQIYLDFSGYSDMAIGLGRMFGFEFDENFNYPYISKSVGEFWRRWHISLGSFFRDYVYIPLGGSRCKTAIENYRNLFVVWFLTGLWHGASWNFILWGLYFGIFIALERVFLSKLLAKIPQFFQHLYLLLVTTIGWVFFRADNLSFGLLYLKRLSGFGLSTDLTNPLLLLHDNALLLVIAILACTPLFKRIAGSISRYRLSPIFESLALIFLYFFSILYLGNSSYSPFIYFRF